MPVVQALGFSYTCTFLISHNILGLTKWQAHGKQTFLTSLSNHMNASAKPEHLSETLQSGFTRGI